LARPVCIPERLGKVNMDRKFRWSEIRQQFRGRWVELTDITWNDTQARPHSARVRRHATSRSALLAEASQDSTVLYITESTTAIEYDSALAL